MSFALGFLITNCCLTSGWVLAGMRGRHVITLNSPQKFREYLEGSNLISKLQAKHDLLKRTLGDGRVAIICTVMNTWLLSLIVKYPFCHHVGLIVLQMHLTTSSITNNWLLKRASLFLQSHWTNSALALADFPLFVCFPHQSKLLDSNLGFWQASHSWRVFWNCIIHLTERFASNLMDCLVLEGWQSLLTPSPLLVQDFS